MLKETTRSLSLRPSPRPLVHGPVGWLALLFLAVLPARADERMPSALEAWGLAAAILEQTGERCGTDVTGVHVPGAGVCSGGAPVVPDSLPPAPRAAQTIEVRQLTVQPSTDTSYRLVLQLALRAADPVDGALVLEDLLARISAQPELVGSLGRPATWPPPDELGLMTGDLKFQFDLSQRPAPERGLTEGHRSIEHALRMLAQRGTAHVSGMRMYPKGKWLELSPVGEARATVGALHRLLSDAETCCPGTVVRGMQIKAPEPTVEGPLADSWTWAATLESQPRGVGPVQRSALEALHLVMGLGDAFERAGVSVEGLQPEYDYGGVRRRSLELSLEQQRVIETRAGYSINVLGLRARDGSLHLDLFFEHPDGGVEATRLFETYCAALRAQPEVLDVSRESARLSGTGVFVHGLTASWRSVEAVRPEAPPRTSGPATYLRKIADSAVIGLGDLHVTPRSGRELEVKLPQPCAQAQVLYNFLWSAETEEQGYLITALDISSAPKVGGFELSATVRSGEE
jgi:hypothetical protein